jgi:hypothetical protein
MGAYDTSESLDWLAELRDHPIFTEPQSQGAPNNRAYSTQQRRICARGPDLVVAAGSEVRIMPLSKMRNTGAALIYKAGLEME